MCGRGRCKIARDKMAQQTDVPASSFCQMDKYTGSDNMAPGSYFPVKTCDKDSNAQLRAMIWGLVPSFKKSAPSPSDHFKMFNARSETVFEKPSFATSMSSKRGIVFMNGYYEWKKEVGGKQPYYVFRKSDALFKMACIFETWMGNGDSIDSFSIITCSSNPKIAWLHDRQPLFLSDPEAEAAWLNPASNRADIMRLLASNGVPADIVTHAVTVKMSNVSYQEEDCCLPIVQERKASSFFLKQDSNETTKLKSSPNREPHSSSQPYGRLHSDEPPPLAKKIITSYFIDNKKRLLKQEEQPVSADDSVACICEHKDGEGEDFKRKKRRLDPVWDLTENSGPLGEDV